MDNILEFIMKTAAEAKKRGLEISIASVSLAKPAEMPATKAATPVSAPKIVEDHSWIAVAEAARMLRCSTTTIYDYIRRRTIEARKDEDGRWVVSSADVATFQKSHHGTPIPVRCVQTGVVYSSLTAAARVLKTDVGNLSAAISAGRPCKNLTFERVND